MKLPYHITIRESTGQDAHVAFIKTGLPLPAGQFYLPSDILLETIDGQALACDYSISCLWPDNSIKWCLIKATVNLSASEEKHFIIKKNHTPVKKVSDIQSCLFEKDNLLTINTKNCTFIFNKDNYNWISQVLINGQLISDTGFCQLKISDSDFLTPLVDNYDYHCSVVQGRILSIELNIHGSFKALSEIETIRFHSQYEFIIDSNLVKCKFTIHNPKSAIHQSGHWDLGDPNSFFFSTLELGLKIPQNSEIYWKSEKIDSWSTLTNSPFSIYQESSGGLNWNSPNHKDHTGNIPLNINGYECRDKNSLVKSGKRATPKFRANTQAGQVDISIDKFWQNFPKSLSFENNGINIGLFPAQFKNGHELQPGEKKTHTFYLSFNPEPGDDTFDTEAIKVTLNPEWVRYTGVFSNFQTDVISDKLYDLIKQGVSGDNSFFNKRETVDEFGWRNFGDLYADHETDGYQGEEIFVSHYNNQYDPIYGFLRQYVLTGNSQWFELADDLASHVTDIDIYNTNLDKDEYNGGFFWHTDHYLDAETSSHRSYSKHQKSNAYTDHAGGGGPGGQHCYTTGLLYHYLFTGNEASKKALFQLSDWITRVYEGSGTFFDFLLALKNRNRVDLKNIMTGKYPLDRGTGNYITALLDKYVLTREDSLIHQVEHIIKNTVHPLDDLTKRDLENVEITWFYTVFFQAVCRYLQTKEELSVLDDNFYYCRDSLLHYADWMSENEEPYLLKSEILEFPNHTWTAQDLRKVNVLLFAEYYSNVSSQRYTKKAYEIYSYITEHLEHENSSTYTRILAILMQNHGVYMYFKNLENQPEFGPFRQYTKPVEYSGLQAFGSISKQFLSAIKSFSISKELNWLARRSRKISQLLRYNT